MRADVRESNDAVGAGSSSGADAERSTDGAGDVVGEASSEKPQPACRSGLMERFEQVSEVGARWRFAQGEGEGDASQLPH